jgi:hypothetical protein
MLTVAARDPFSKSWFDQAAAAPVVSSTAATTPPRKYAPSLVRSSRHPKPNGDIVGFVAFEHDAKPLRNGVVGRTSATALRRRCC